MNRSENFEGIYYGGNIDPFSGDMVTLASPVAVRLTT